MLLARHFTRSWLMLWGKPQDYRFVGQQYRIPKPSPSRKSGANQRRTTCDLTFREALGSVPADLTANWKLPTASVADETATTVVTPV
jgi:hypothetical protein